MAINVTIHAIGTGLCALTGHEADGLAVTFGDASLQNTFLSWRSFKQLAALKFAQMNGGAGRAAAPPLPAAREA